MKTPTVFEAHESYVLGLSFTGDSQMLASIGMDNVIRLWSVPDWGLVRTLEGHTNSVNTMSLSPDGKVLATGSTDMTVKLWSFPDGKVLHSLQDRKKVVSAVQISPDGEWVAAGSYGGRAQVWSLGGEEIVGIQASKKNLSSVAFSPDGKILAVSGLGEDISLWELPSGERVGVLSGHQVAVGSLTFIQEGRYLVSMGHERTVRFWDTGSWQEERVIRLVDPGVRGLVFSPDEKRVALSLEGRVQIWGVEACERLAELPVSTKVVSALAFSPDGRWLAAGAADRKIRVWEIWEG